MLDELEEPIAWWCWSSMLFSTAYFYGPAGAAIIESTLMSLFGLTNFRTQCTLPLSFCTYTQYFLVPHLASQLIAEDKNTDGEGGWEIMLRSAKVGDTLQSLTDQEGLLEDIFTANVNRRKGWCILDVAPELAERDQDHVNEEVLVSAPSYLYQKLLIWYWWGRTGTLRSEMSRWQRCLYTKDRGRETFICHRISNSNSKLTFTKLVTHYTYLCHKTATRHQTWVQVCTLISDLSDGSVIAEAMQFQARSNKMTLLLQSRYLHHLQSWSWYTVLKCPSVFHLFYIFSRFYFLFVSVAWYYLWDIQTSFLYIHTSPHWYLFDLGIFRWINTSIALTVRAKI